MNFIIKELTENEKVVLDVPVGHLRMHDTIMPNGEGAVIFSVADGHAQPGTRVRDTVKNEALHMICQTPEKAETIAKAFVELAIHMREAAKE